MTAEPTALIHREETPACASSEAVLVITPIGRDKDLICEMLARTGVHAFGPGEPSSHAPLPFGVLLLGEEALDTPGARTLIETLQHQPVWSDLPVIIIASTHGFVGRNRENAQEIFNTSNVTFLQRPVPTMSLVSTVRAALRARTRQYEVRNLLEDRERQLHERDAFLAMLGHELRNPLAPVRNAIYVWKAPHSSESQREKARESMERQVTHISRLVDDLLDVARVSRGKISLKKERCDLLQIIRGAADDHRTQIEKAGIVLDVHLPPHPVWTLGDCTRLTQVFGNLIQNAAKFTDAKQRITIDVALPESDSARITISDTGIGMTPATLGRIFEPFNQGDVTLERNRGGLGLGLAVAKKLVELHGGKIEASSAGLSKGSTFTVTLPVERSNIVPLQKEILPMTKPSGHSVLLVEDNADAAETTKLVLELMGHTVVHAFDGAQAIKIARDLHPDIVLCDIGLPGMNGYEVAAVLRKELIGSRLIALTGYGQQEDHSRARDAGFDLHLTKPVDPTLLEATLSA